MSFDDESDENFRRPKRSMREEGFEVEEVGEIAAGREDVEVHLDVSSFDDEVSAARVEKEERDEREVSSEHEIKEEGRGLTLHT